MTELTSQTLQLYKRVIAMLFDFTRTPRRMSYRALVVDMEHSDHAMNNGRNREIALARFVFSLVFGFARSFGPNIQYRVWIDSRPNSVHDVDMDQRMLDWLNNKSASEFGWKNPPFVSVTFLDSKGSRLIQAVDVITGAIAYEANRKHFRVDASKHRVALLRHAVSCSRLDRLAEESPPGLIGFQVRRM